MSKKVLVTGANGQLGKELRHESSNYDYKFIFTDSSLLDVTDQDYVREFIEEHRPNYIINCAAYTNVDAAEEETHLSDAVNNKAVKTLATLAKEYKISLIHISTDYVFSGESSETYTESMFAQPENNYGKTKLAGERAVQDVNPANSIIIRTSWLYSKYGNNFVNKILELSSEHDILSIVVDQVGTPTWARNLANFILDILPKLQDIENVEVFHYSSEGECSRYSFVKSILEFANRECKIAPISSAEYKTTAKRPLHTVLCNNKVKKYFNIDIPHWRNSLKDCIIDL